MGACTIVGVDCATDPKNVGLACGLWQEEILRITAVDNGQFRAPEEIISGWITASERVLLALDAPLGWPQTFGRTLAEHTAGKALQQEPNRFFRRETDRFVQRTFGKTPLDVGADRIARTALAALQLLDRLSLKAGFEIPLAWGPEFSKIATIEVYPAGTLRASRVPASAYKRPEQSEARQRLLGWLANEADLPEDHSLPLTDPDVLDAMICVLAGADFLAGRAYSPTDLALAQKEGWIWIRK
jgi:predicted RNase H-like nuclease